MRWIGLLDVASIHNDDISERHGFDLVMGDIDDRGPKPLLQFLSSMRVFVRSCASRVGKRFIKEKSFGFLVARPMATRWRWPPERSGLRSSSS